MKKGYSVFIAVLSSFCLMLSALIIFMIVPDIDPMATDLSLSSVFISGDGGSVDDARFAIAVAVIFTFIAFIAILGDSKKVSKWVVIPGFILAIFFLCTEVAVGLKLFL
ncbi:hypothetical protein H6790_02745 [Candidatus Nomurabacteria bacterium]|nr:hypothetical protein [Candidatus Nomurabacteria bacterium]MCB9820838.1 hypothetical protein [Candidatus Nomurabacteria bacterium]